MKQMQVPESLLVKVNYEDEHIPASAKEFRPAVYQDGDSYCALLGEDPQAGIFGCGATKQEALQDWDKHFSERMKDHPEGDELVQYIEDTRKISKKDVW